ncbi:MAG: cytochrome c biogenesis protein CcdA [Candidatus Altiarchaeota archaeon]
MNPELIITSVMSGLFAAFSPCSIPVYPVILNLIASEKKDRRSSAIAFCIGLSITFTAFYIAVGFSIKMLGDSAGDFLGRVYFAAYALAALSCFLSVIQTVSELRILNFSLGPRFGARGGLFGAVLTGALFATIVSPCNLAFIITGILPVVLARPTVAEGVVYMFAFSMSLGAPMMAFGLLSGHAFDSWLKRHMRGIELASAAFLAIAGTYLAYMAWLNI